MKKSADSNTSPSPSLFPSLPPKSFPTINLTRVPIQTHISVFLELMKCTHT